MKKIRFNEREVLVFRQFSRKNYALFSCVGKVVLIGTLSVMTLTYAKADGMSTHTDVPDTVSLSGTKTVVLDELKVTSSRAPLTLLQSAKIVAVITRDDIHRAAVTTVNDVLKLATGVDVRQRGGFGVQTDISINGGTFDQITILLNGICVSNPQTGHNAADFPVGLNDIERIEVLEGANAAVFGSNAFSGAINIVTRNPIDNNCKTLLKANLEGGSYGTVGAGLGIESLYKGTARHASAGFSRSDGGIEHSDFQKGRLFYATRWHTTNTDIHLQLGANVQSFGASTFYSSKFNNQFEHNEHVVASLSATVKDVLRGLDIKPVLYFNHFSDHYQLIRGQEGADNGENYHRLNIVGASISLNYSWAMGETAIGADVTQERILSTAYGRLLPENKWRDIENSDRKYDHKGGRTNNSFFAEHNVLLDRWTFSAGLLLNRNTGLDGDYRLYPGIDVAFRPTNRWKIFASWNKALRMPTYTDLYISNKVQQGDTNLRPEKNDTYKTGARFSNQRLTATLSAFYSHGTDMIDWVYMSADATKYHAMNIGRLNNMGASVDMTIHFSSKLKAQSSKLKIGYAYIHQNYHTPSPSGGTMGGFIYKSLYALEYLRHKVTATLDMRLWRQLTATTTLRWQQRMNGYHPYFKLDAKVQWNASSYTLYLQADNLTNHRYYDLAGVPQPGLWLMAGANISITP